MIDYKRCWFLLLAVIVLLFSSPIACGKPAGYVTYTNDKGGYAISYPSNWQVEVTEDGTACLIKSLAGRASVMIDVKDPMPAQDAAKFWIMSIGSAWGEVTKFEDKPMQDFWDWYLSYDYDTDIGTYHGEAYFKQTDKHLYRVDAAADKNGYSMYPFTAIISTFKPLR